MIKMEKIYFGNLNTGHCINYTLSTDERMHLKFSASLIIQGLLIEGERVYIRSDNMRELYKNAYRIARHYIKHEDVDVCALIFGHQNKNIMQWYSYRPLVIYK